MRIIFTLLLFCAAAFGHSQSTTLVISQFYGAGGNTGATLDADYVELHNISGAPVSINGMSIQYSSATNTGVWTGVAPLPAASIPAGGYYLIQMGAAGPNGAPLPTPDYFANPTIAMSGTSGKLALVANITPLSGCVFPSADVIDGVGYGTSNCAEGTATAVLTPVTGAIRNNNGCDETDNNLADFTVTTPAPRNSASAVFTCAVTVTPTLTASAIVDFGSVLISTSSASQSFNLSGTNLTGAPGTITITAPSTDFQVSNDNSTWGAVTTIPYTAASLSSIQIWVRFTPQTTGPKTGNVTVSGGGATTINVAVSGNGIAPAATLSATTPDPFQATCISQTSGPNSFSITGTNLIAGDITVGPLTGYEFSTSPSGSFSPTLVVPATAGNFVATVFVNFTPPAIGNYNGSIPVSGAGVSGFGVNVVASGTNASALVVTNNADSIGANAATARGSQAGAGCSPVTEVGIEFSGINGFQDGYGIKVPATSVNGSDFASRLTRLVPDVSYYYKAYAKSATGTAYGVQQSFKTDTLYGGLIIYGTPIIRNQNLHYSLRGIEPALKSGHYSVRIHNSVGQLVLQRDIIIQVNFIDDNFIFPGHLPMGFYNMEIRNYEYHIQKSFWVQ